MCNPVQQEKWIRELKGLALEELGKMDRGSTFRQTVELILARDQNWIAWKLQSCVPFEKPALDAASASDKARAQLAAATRKPKAFPYRLGNPTLSRLWERNLSSLDDFSPARPEDSLDGLVRSWAVANRQLVGKRTQLKVLQAGAPQRAELAGQVAGLEVKARALHWRVIRRAALSHLHLFAKIGAGEVEVLVKLMEEERRREMEEEEAREQAEESVQEEEVVVEGQAKKGDQEEESEVALGTGGLTPVAPPSPVPVPAPEPEVDTLAPRAAPPAEVVEDKSAAPVAVAAVVEEAAVAVSKPGTPKRAREGEDEEMAEGEQGSAKKARLEVEADGAGEVKEETAA